MISKTQRIMIHMMMKMMNSPEMKSMMRYMNLNLQRH